MNYYILNIKLHAQTYIIKKELTSKLSKTYIGLAIALVMQSSVHANQTRLEKMVGDYSTAELVELGQKPLTNLQLVGTKVSNTSEAVIAHLRCYPSKLGWQD